MSLPVETLRDFVKDNWALTTDDVTKNDVSFTLTDANKLAPDKPHVFFYLMGFKRLQPAESALYEFTFMIGVEYWNKTVHKTCNRQTNHWLMIDHIKKMFDSDKPNGWEYAYVDDGFNDALGKGTLPEQNLFSLTVKACIAWT